MPPSALPARLRAKQVLFNEENTPFDITLRRDGRDREIRARFNGGNYRALASQFRLSERQIRKIVNGTRV